MPQEGQPISWEVHTHAHREHSVDWYWGLGVAAGGGAVLSLLFGNFLLAVILIIGGMSIGILASRAPREHTVRIDQRGVSIDGTLYRYQSIRSFWVDEEREGLPEERRHPHLYLSTTGVVAPHLTLPLKDRAQADQIRAFLRRRAKEEEQGAHLGEQIAELFGL